MPKAKNTSDNSVKIKIPKNEGDGPSWIAIVITAAIQIWPVAGLLLFLKLRRIWQNNKLEKYRTYARAIGDQLAISIKELAQTVGDSKSDTRDTLQAMISKGYMGPEAYIDRADDMLYILRSAKKDKKAKATDKGFADFSDLPGNLSDVISSVSGIAREVAHTLRNEYVDNVARTLRDEFKGFRGDGKPRDNSNIHHYAPSGSRPAEEPAPAQEPAPEPAPKADAAADDAGRSESEATIARLKKLNDDIDDIEVSAKIDRIAMLTGDIYAFVELNPERAGEVRKFMNYYLPTTMKLLTSYSLLEKQSYQGENIVNARGDIEKILETLVHAFEKQLDQLFATDAVDISSDIQVLETMMAKDGLASDQKGYTLRL